MRAQGHNQFNALRAIAAALVFYSHSYALAHRPEPWFLGATSFGGLGVAIFFGISGYLVTTSFQRDTQLRHFLAKRALRIFPALILVSVVCAYGLGPLLTTLDLGTYFGHPNTHAYVYKNIALSPRFDLPGVFANNPFPGAVNGSLWTLPLECFLYVVIAAFCVIPTAKYQQRATLVLAVGFGVLSYLTPMYKFIYYGSDMYQIMYHAPYFFVGAYLSYRRDWVREHGQRYILPLSVGLVALGGTPLVTIAAWIAIPCITIFVGERRSAGWPWVETLGDISYGVYLWSFPFQQLMIQRVMPKAGLFPAMMLAALGTLIAAYLSWTLVERPVLRLKSKLSHADQS